MCGPAGKLRVDGTAAHDAPLQRMTAVWQLALLEMWLQKTEDLAR